MSYRFWICEDCCSDYVAVKDNKLQCVDCGSDQLSYVSYHVHGWAMAKQGPRLRADARERCRKRKQQKATGENP